MIKHVPCRNQVTGAEADIPETALQHLPSWRPIGQPDTANDPADTTADPDPEPEQPAPAGPARKRKAAAAAKTDKE